VTAAWPDAVEHAAMHGEREQVGGVLGVVEDVRRGLVDRHRARLRGRVDGLACVERERLGLVRHLDCLLLAHFRATCPGNE
jgi:hypothetical protein